MTDDIESEQAPAEDDAPAALEDGPLAPMVLDEPVPLPAVDPPKPKRTRATTKAKSSTAEADEPAGPPKGYRRLRYDGGAASFRHGDFVFRGGVALDVPNAIAEELLTYPFERFREVEE